MATASSLDSVAEIEDLLTCSICSETLSEPRSLHCFHNFCKVCLGKYVERLRGPDKNIETFPCPTCRSEFTLKSTQNVADLASNYFIKNMLEIMAIQRQAKAARCSSCQETAVSRCMTCEMFMCEKCSNYHSIWPVMKDHDVLSVEELSNPQSQVKMRSKLYCVKHKDKILEFYCETCKELSCLHCMVLNHIKQNHSCVSVEEIAQKQREILQGSCTTLDEKLSAGKEALSAVGEVMKSLEANAKDAKAQINAQKDKILTSITEKLEVQAKKLAQDVDNVYSELHGELTKQHGEIKDYLDKVQASVSLPRNLLKRGSVEEIVSLQKVIDENIEKLQNEQPENLAPVNDGGVQYIPRNIENINYGDIVDKLGNINLGQYICSTLNISKSPPPWAVQRLHNPTLESSTPLLSKICNICNGL